MRTDVVEERPVDGGGKGTGRAPSGAWITLEELRRRNASAIGMDILYLFTTGFLGTLAAKGPWPALIAAGPLATFLFFAWKSSRPFFVANVAAIAIAVAASALGLVPL